MTDANKPKNDAEVYQDFKALRGKAKILFMQFVPRDEIVRRLDMSEVTFSIWVNKYGWEKERNEVVRSVVNDVKDQGRRVLAEVSRISLSMVYKSLSHRSQQPAPLTLREAQVVTDILSKLDRIARLDDGEPTDIVAGSERLAPISIEELRTIVAKDAFIDIIPIKKTKDVTNAANTGPMGHDASEQYVEGNNAGPTNNGYNDNDGEPTNRTNDDLGGRNNQADQPSPDTGPKTEAIDDPLAK